jgi:hypothetical protein
MRATFALAALFLSVGLTSVCVAQAPAVTHNTWTDGAPIPTPVSFAAAAVLKGEIYLVGGYDVDDYSEAVADTQIYDPVTNTWSSGTPLPTVTAQAVAAVVGNVLYVFGGTNNGGVSVSSAVWAYNPKTKAWSSKAAMPTARCSIAATVENNVIYVIGGYNGSRLATVEGYNPATNTWTEEAPMLVGKSEPSVGLVGTKLTGFTIVAAGGYYGGPNGSDNGDNEGYDAATNTWTSLTSEPNPRSAACGGAVGQRMYAASGGDYYGPAVITTESFKLSKNAWTTLASIPQGTVAPASAIYKGRLYCLGGWASTPDGTLLNTVQIYQP